jgi:phage-related protein
MPNEEPDLWQPQTHCRKYKFLYILPMDIKPVEFLGDSLDALREFPDAARQDAGYQLDKVQHGLDPDDWKPMSTIGAGIRELRIRDVTGAFRVIYLARLADAVYVLHCFQKKTQRTSLQDIRLAKSRFNELMRREQP